MGGKRAVVGDRSWLVVALIHPWLVVVAAVSHSECVMSAERLWEAARTGLGRSPPAGVCV